jgi:glyoxylase-like metal-dependent hydrolase (beta-lactamase superfamily II)
MVHIVPEVIRQLKDYSIPEERVKRIVILHAHFDHCGIVPFFKKRWPWSKVTASARAKELLASSQVIETIARLNGELIETYGRQAEAEKLELDFNGIKVDEVVGDGDLLNCGELAMEVLEVPGHSSCSIAIYVKDDQALFTSDAGGIPFGRKIFTAANSSFDRYQESLKKMADYRPQICLAEHFGALTGEDGRQFLSRSMDSAARTRQAFEKSLARTGSVEESTAELTEVMMANQPGNLLPREVIAMVIGQMLSNLKKHH